MYVHVSNATGMQLLQTYFLWVWHCCTCSTKQVKSIALQWNGLQRGGSEQDGYVCSKTEALVARRGGNIGGRFIDNG